MAAPKSRGKLPHLPYPKMNVTRTINAHRAAAAGGGPLLTGLAAWWTFNEASGTRADSHVNGIDLTDNNTVSGTTGLLSNAASFDKANSEYFNAADDSALDFTTEFTASLWLKQVAYGGSDYETYLAKGTFTSSSFVIYNRYSASTLKILLNYNAILSQFNLTSFTLSTSSFDHLVVVYDGSQSTNATKLRVFLNNSEKTGSGSFTGTVPTSLLDRSGDLYVGYMPGLTNSYFSGAMDEVGLWGRALSTDEISDLYNSGAGITYDDL